MSTLDVVTPESVRDYLQVTDTTREWSTGILGSNILLASSRLQRITNRQWEPVTETKTFTTEGREFLPVPDFTALTSVVFNGATLTADATYYAIPSRAEEDIFIGIQFPRSQLSGWYPGLNTFDINYNHVWHGRRYLPNDLTMTGDWGRDEADWPIEVIQAIRAFAGFLTLRAAAALLSGAKQTPEGNVFDMSRWPLEVKGFIEAWANFDQAVTIG